MRAYIKRADLTVSEQRFVYEYCNTCDRIDKLEQCIGNRKLPQNFLFTFFFADELLALVNRAKPKRPQGKMNKQALIRRCQEALKCN